MQQLCDRSLRRTIQSIVSARGINADRLEPLIDGRTVESQELVKIGLADAVLGPVEALEILRARMRTNNPHDGNCLVNQLKAKHIDRLRTQAITRTKQTEFDEIEEERLFRQIISFEEENQDVEILRQLAEVSKLVEPPLLPILFGFPLSFGIPFKSILHSLILIPPAVIIASSNEQ